MVSHYIARISNRQIRAVRQVHELSELFTENELQDTGNTGDGEEYERESKTVIFASALFALLSMLF